MAKKKPTRRTPPQRGHPLVPAGPTGPMGEILLFQSEDGRSRVECRFLNESLWLSQAGMAELFQTTKQNVAKHLKAIFAEGEMAADSVVNHWLTTAADGKEYRVSHYNLEAILSVGYRVRSTRGTQFRRWATERLGEYLLKGFTMDDERLKNPPVAGSSAPDHFAQMLERVRDIRASERRMYLRVREIFALAADYEPSLPETTQFFRIIQNKLHFAVTGQTAAELIAQRADAGKPNMGLTSWQGGAVRPPDVVIAKNYLRESEIGELNRVVSMWLDFAEDQATRRKQVFLEDWETKLNEFLRFNDRSVLPNAGKVSKREADAMARQEYERFSAGRRSELEAQGAEDGFRDLEDTLERLPPPPEDQT